VKILIIRFSSIGDIVLTTPVIRCCRQQVKGVEIHFVTKNVFKPVLVNNPYVDKIIGFDKDVSEVYDVLKKEKYDHVIDLHNNLRSLRLKLKLGKKSHSFKKLNVQKWLTVRTKNKSFMPPVHIVERYLETVSSLGVKNDQAGLDYFLAEKDHVDITTISASLSNGFTALVIGGSYYTKKIPHNKLLEICRLSKSPIVFMGGKEDADLGEKLLKETSNTFNACGKFSINQSASIVKQAALVITSDTGLMHIAAAFGKKIISVWGNTIPEFGMYAYKPHPESLIMEINNLSCRPCSKLGYPKCPLGHFKCMNDIDYTKLNL
jgi:ADP-heptose:LPS heptosyltransferase